MLTKDCRFSRGIEAPTRFPDAFSVSAVPEHEAVQSDDAQVVTNTVKISCPGFNSRLAYAVLSLHVALVLRTDHLVVT